MTQEYDTEHLKQDQSFVLYSLLCAALSAPLFGHMETEAELKTNLTG